MRGNRRGRTAAELDAEPVVKHGSIDGLIYVIMVGQQCGRKMFQAGCLLVNSGILGGKKVAVQILADVATRGVIAESGQPGIA